MFFTPTGTPPQMAQNRHLSFRKHGNAAGRRATERKLLFSHFKELKRVSHVQLVSLISHLPLAVGRGLLISGASRRGGATEPVFRLATTIILLLRMGTVVVAVNSSLATKRRYRRQRDR